MSRRWLGLCSALFLVIATQAGAASNYKPTRDEVAAVDARTGAYFQAMARADYAQSYAMLTPVMQSHFTPERWASLGAEFQALRGEQYERTRTATTWLLDPPDSAGPGLYAIIDFRGRSDNAPEQLEYLIWYRPPGESEFRLLRHEQNLGNMQPSAATKPPSSPPLEEAAKGGSDIGYATVAEAREGLARKRGATTTDTPEGWRIVVEKKPEAVWSFAPAGHPAFPSVVRRAAVKRKGGTYIEMSAICEADKAACDRLIREFQAMNQKAIDNAR